MDNKEMFMWQSFSAHVCMSVSAKNPQKSVKKGGKILRKECYYKKQNLL